MQSPWEKLCPACSLLPLQQLQQAQAAAARELLLNRDKAAWRDSRERPVVVVVVEAGAEDVATDANNEGPVEPSTEVLLVVEAVVAAVDVTAETKSSMCTSRAC